MRGGDLTYTPVALCFAILHADASVDLFIDRRKFSGELAQHLGPEVRHAQPDALGAALARLGAGKKRVVADPANCAAWIFDRLAESGAVILRAPDPCLLPKACKNPVELEGTRNAHRRDGAALTRFLAWLVEAASKGGLKEIAVSGKLEEFRRQAEHFKGLSFATISGAGANGAIVHYHASPRTERVLENGSALSGRFRRAISRRHHRRHPHGGDRQPERGNARPLHPGAEGPYRPGLLPLSARHHRLATRRAGAPAAVGSRARLRPRHRPRRRLLSRRA